MVVMLPKIGKNPLAGLLDNTTRQASNLAFNIQFNNLQNTVIDRFNKEVDKLTNASGNQRELNELTKAYNKHVTSKNSAVKFAFANESNGDRFGELSTTIAAAVNALTAGADGDSDTVSAEEVTNFETARDSIIAISDRLVELNHPDFIDGDNVSRLREQIEALLELNVVEGTVDPFGSGTTTNDNRAAYDILYQIESINNASVITTATLETSAKNYVAHLDGKLGDLNKEILEINVFRAGKIEYEIQMLKTRNANFLRSIELSFEAQVSATDALVNALNTDREIPKGSILSILT